MNFIFQKLQRRITSLRTLKLIAIYIYIFVCQCNNIILGNWNSIVGDEPYRNIIGSHGLGRQNHGGQMLIDFCERIGMIVTNIWFKKPKRRLYTWKAPGDWNRHQLDTYILVKHRFRNSVNDVHTMPGADIDSDHNLLVAKSAPG